MSYFVTLKYKLGEPELTPVPVEGGQWQDRIDTPAYNQERSKVVKLQYKRLRQLPQQEVIAALLTEHALEDIAGVLTPATARVEQEPETSNESLVDTSNEPLVETSQELAEILDDISDVLKETAGIDDVSERSEVEIPAEVLESNTSDGSGNASELGSDIGNASELESDSPDGTQEVNGTIDEEANGDDGTDDSTPVNTPNRSINRSTNRSLQVPRSRRSRMRSPTSSPARASETEISETEGDISEQEVEEALPQKSGKSVSEALKSLREYGENYSSRRTVGDVLGTVHNRQVEEAWRGDVDVAVRRLFLLREAMARIRARS